MTKIFVFLISSFISLSCFSQISGNFKNFDPQKHSEIEISVFYNSYTSKNQEELKIKPDNWGNFSITLPIDAQKQIAYCKIPGYFNGSLVVDQGIELNLDANKKKEVHYAQKKYTIFSGPDAAVTSYINQAFRIKSKSFHTKRGDLVFRSKDSLPDRLSQLWAIYDEQYERVNKFIKKYPSEYGQVVLDQLKSNCSSDLLTIYGAQPIPNFEIITLDNFKPKYTDYYAYNIYTYLHYNLYYGNKTAYSNRTKNVIKSKIDSSQLADFESFMKEYEKRQERKAYDKTIYAEGKKNYLEVYNLAIMEAHTRGFADTIQQVMHFNLDNLILSGIPDNSDERSIYFKHTKPLVKSEWVLEIMQEIEQKDEERLNQMLNMIVDTEEVFPLGEPVGWNTKVQMYHATKDTLSELLSAIHNHFPGKMVLLDIWGTWCGPCVSDIKKSKTKIEELKANNIEVVYLCEGNGSKIATWQEKVLDYEMRGLQLFMSPVLTNQFLEKFKITGYPSHVIMDADGNFHLDDNHFIADLKLNDILKMVKE